MQAESSLIPQRPSSGCLRMWALGDRVAGAQVLAATGQAGWLAGNSRWRCRQWLARPSLLNPFLVALMHIQYSVLLILSMIFHYPNFLTRAKKKWKWLKNSLVVLFGFFLIVTFTRTAFDSIYIFPWRAPIPTAAKRAKSAVSLGLSTCRTTYQEITMSGLKDNIFHKVCITYRSGKWQHNFCSALPSVVQFPCSKLLVPAPWQVSHKSFPHFRYLYSLCWNKFKGKLEPD